MNCTAPPAGVPSGEVTVALKVTDWPRFEGFLLELTLVVVAAKGVAFAGLDFGEVFPAALVAVTWKVYAVPFLRPLTMMGLVVPVVTAVPGLW
jgi:hypothetical protein